MTTEEFDTVTVAGKTTLWLDSNRIDACMAHYRAAHVDWLGINRVRGYAGKDLAFLRDHPDVRALLVVPSLEAFDLEPVRALRHLRALVLGAPAAPLPLDEFPELEEFRGAWDPALRLEGHPSLRALQLIGYSSPSKDLTAFPKLPALRELTLIQGNATSLAGVSALASLRHLELSSIAKLKSLHDAEALSSLEALYCDRCRQLGDYERIRGMRALRALRLNDCGALPSLRLLDDLPALEEFRFVGTNVEDGDLTPVLRLQRVGFLAKKHYSHSPKEVDAILAKRGAPAHG